MTQWMSIHLVAHRLNRHRHPSRPPQPPRTPARSPRCNRTSIHLGVHRHVTLNRHRHPSRPPQPPRSPRRNRTSIPILCQWAHLHVPQAPPLGKPMGNTAPALAILRAPGLQVLRRTPLSRHASLFGSHHGSIAAFPYLTTSLGGSFYRIGHNSKLRIHRTG